MTKAWKLSRNRYGRAVYDRLQALGVTATLMTEYVAALPTDGATDRGANHTVGVVDPERVASLGAPRSELQPGEVVIAAFDGDEPAGYLFCSLDATHTIDPLERERSFEGAYIRRVFVDPDRRNRGVATALVAHACRWASDRGAARATALVARDNVPSRRLFEREGFEPARTHGYIRLGRFSYYRTY
ncbi:GNAT family N-acetyltransferase [Halobellus rubicundus]|uniref:GNAT family N-acetyltransferase n=1 Tax=Halobellus rubicundus TaxID=2996466 RepID=A0ABD5M913_9EURY